MLLSLIVCSSYPLLFGLICLIVCHRIFLLKNRESDKLLDKIPGPRPRYPIIGNLDIFRIRDVPLNQSIFRVISALAKVYEEHGLFKIKLGLKDAVVVFRQNTMNSILASNSNNDKSDEYSFLWPWLGSGLLTSTGSLWKSRRRMLTPAFHFKILEDFIPIMNEQSNILVDNLKNACNKPFIDIREPLTQCTLDVICETAMGVSIGAQVGNNKDYVTAIHNLGELFMKRLFSPWIWSDFFFFKTDIGRAFNKDLNILHSMTRNVIKERKDNILSEKSQITEEKTESIEESNIYVSDKSRKRMAFLDLLLNYHIQNNSLTLEDIREEVDTFMFEGHDTTSVSLSWTLYLMGLHPQVQYRVQQELDSIFGDDRQRKMTATDLKNMVYLESVIKESLRLFPSVPYIGRTVGEDVKSGDYLIPKGTTVFLLMERLHYDPKVFADPLHFKPERFLENSTNNINAYSYVPFSAGARSCIGQRFALTEEKIILAKIFLNFNVKSLDQRDQMITSVELVFRSKHPIRVKVVQRVS